MDEHSLEARSQTCPICASAVREWRTKRTGNASYRIDRCGACGFAFVNPRPSLEFLIDYYASVGHHLRMRSNDNAPTLALVAEQERAEPNSTLDARRLVGTIKALRLGHEGCRFFDVGCGYGFFSRQALREGFEVVALDLAENERRIAAAMTGLSPLPISFEEYEGEPASLAAILMSQVLEHAQDVNAWIAKSRRLLQPHGILAIALPNFGSATRLLLQENEPYITPPEHLSYFSAGNLSGLLNKHGFRVEKVEWVSRIPPRALEKRLPRLSRPALALVSSLAGTSQRLLDAMGLGVMLNVYGRKLPA